jgi:hypothetical protein
MEVITNVPRAGLDQRFLTDRITSLRRSSKGSRLLSLVFDGAQGGVRKWIGPLAVGLYDLIASKVPAERRQRRGRQQAVFNMRAIRLTVELLNTYPDLRVRAGLAFKPADLISRLQKRGRKAQP